MHSVAAFVVSLKSAEADTGVEKNAKEKKEERDFGLSKFFALHESKALFKADAAKFLRSIPTLRLRDYRETPCLMEHDSGLAVYCGIPGCSVANVTVFLPLEDGHQEIDPQILAKRLAELGHGDLELSCPEIDDRPTLGNSQKKSTVRRDGVGTRRRRGFSPESPRATGSRPKSGAQGKVFANFQIFLIFAAAASRSKRPLATELCFHSMIV